MVLNVVTEVKGARECLPTDAHLTACETDRCEAKAADCGPQPAVIVVPVHNHRLRRTGRIVTSYRSGDTSCSIKSRKSFAILKADCGPILEFGGKIQNPGVSEARFGLVDGYIGLSWMQTSVVQNGEGIAAPIVAGSAGFEYH